MNKIFKKKTLLIGSGLILLLGIVVVLFFDAFYGGDNFRTFQDPISSSENVNLTGLRNIQASGGNAPRFADLTRRLSHINKNKIIVDVKCEYHGYINSIPTTFLGYGLPNPGLRRYIRRFLWTGSFNERTDLVTTEAEEAKKYGFIYRAVTIGSKFAATDDNIDDIMNFFDTLPKDAWLHIHCTNGKGRTSTILAMLDIMHNAPQVTLADIVKRHHLLGSVNLFNTTVWAKGTYSKDQLVARKKFLINFYDFICQRKAGGIQQWSNWHPQKTERKELNEVAFH
ncbi:MAG: hypothetical protein K2W92_00255 [Alphaproteobacteria bacterium]|nr:hypothetical protein [Alphaproteobacteria bacterium]